jgi:hypothetical protein
MGKKTRDVQDFFDSVLVVPFRNYVKVCNALVELKVKVKFSLEQAMKAQRGSRGIALLFL